MTMKQRKVRVPYTNYKLPPSAEQGGQFVDFNKVMKRKKVKVTTNLVLRAALVQRLLWRTSSQVLPVVHLTWLPFQMPLPRIVILSRPQVSQATTICLTLARTTLKATTARRSVPHNPHVGLARDEVVHVHVSKTVSMHAY